MYTNLDCFIKCSYYHIIIIPCFSFRFSNPLFCDANDCTVCIFIIFTKHKGNVVKSSTFLSRLCFTNIFVKSSSVPVLFHPFVLYIKSNTNTIT